jgi:type III pantothenate kinase
MILDLDVGNTRLKWRSVDARGKVLARGVQGGGDALATLAAQLDKPQRIRVACVRDAKFKEQLRERINACWGLEAEFARSALQAAGVITAYAQPENLGVDRWLTMLAAKARGQGACCIIDAGSALTVDLLRGDGQHLGGYIVPGLAMQRASLLERTAIRLPESLAWEGVAPGASTADAIHHGILDMIVTWVQVVSEPMLKSGGTLYLTGGDAQVFSAQLKARSVPHELVADLVLEGLAAVLP